MAGGTQAILHGINKNMPKGLGYTMLGRSARREDIHIVGGFDKEGIKCDPDALEESKRLEKVFNDAQQERKDKIDSHWKISYLNVANLIAHHEDVVVDNEINDSDIFGLGETHLVENAAVSFDNYAGYFANFGKGKGQAAFTKIDLLSEPEIVATKNYSLILLKTSYFNIVFLYLSQECTKGDVFTLLNNWINNETPTTVMGDVNENLLENSRFEKFMKSKGFSQMITKPTHKYGSMIDHLYVNEAMKQKNIFCEQNCCYYSDHDIISLYIKQ